MTEQAVTSAIATEVWFFEVRTPPLWRVMGWLCVDDAGRRRLGLPARRGLKIRIASHVAAGADTPPVLHKRGTGQYSVSDISKLFILFAEAGAEFEANDGETEIARCPQEED